MEGETFLPEELKIKILLKLSIKTLLQLKSVCKSWKSLIGSPTFITCYSTTSQVRNSSKLLWFRQDPIEKKLVISLIDCQETKKIVDLEWPPFLDRGINNKEEFDGVINILGPVNGVYCIFNRLIDRWVGTLILWNPATRDYKHIFPLVAFPFSSKLFHEKYRYDHWYYKRQRPRGLNVGFGFDNKINDFKVVVICHWEWDDGMEDDSWHVRVYNLSTNSWRTIYYIKPYDSSALGGLDTFSKITSYPEFVHCYLNGVFHWSTGSEYEILAFDMAIECFQLINGPPLPKYHYPCSSVWVYKETLAMAFTILEDNRYPCGAFVWIMKEYGVEDSWTQLYSCGPTSGLTVIGIPNDNEFFFSDSNGQLISSNFQDQGFKGYGVYGTREPEFFPNIYGSQGVLRYYETFVPLKPMQQD